MSPLRVVLNTGRPGGRFYVCDRRCHHGAVGMALAAGGAARGGLAGAAMVCAGLVLMYHDRGDFARTLWVRDR